MSDLRDRIKHLLDAHRCPDCADDPPDWTGHLADVLIRELGLPPTWGKPSFDNGTQQYQKGVHS